MPYPPGMRAWVVVLLWLISAEVAFAQDDVPAPAAPRPHGSLRGDDPIGGSADIGTQIRWDAEPKRALLRRDPLERWFQWKDCFAKRTGLNWQANYNFLYMKASESLGHREAAGGIFELNATWDLVNRHSPNKGILGFRLESRHKLGTEIAPAALGGEIGSLWRPDVLWSERDFSLSQLWWEQRFLRGRAALRFGKLISPAVIYDNFVLRVPQLALQALPAGETAALAVLVVAVAGAQQGADA